MRKVSLNTAAQLALAQLKAGSTPFLVGPPGIGKTELANQIAESLELKKVHILNASQISREDLMYPVVKEDGESKVLDFITHDFTDTLLVLDEFSNAPKSVLSALLTLLTEKRIGSIRFDGLRIIVTGNNIDDSSLAVPLPSPAINRLSIIHMNPPTKEEWSDYMSKYVEGHPMYVQFVVSKLPQKLFMAPIDTELVEYVPFPTPRSHTRVAKTLNVNFGDKDLSKLTGDEQTFLRHLVAADVGEEVANVFMQYLSSVSSMFTLTQLERGELPTDMDQVFFLLYDVSNTLNNPVSWWRKNLTTEEGKRMLFRIALTFQRLLLIPEQVEEYKVEFGRILSTSSRFIFPTTIGKSDAEVIEVVKLNLIHLTNELEEGNIPKFATKEEIEEVKRLYSKGNKLRELVKRASVGVV